MYIQHDPSLRLPHYRRQLFAPEQPHWIVFKPKIENNAVHTTTRLQRDASSNPQAPIVPPSTTAQTSDDKALDAHPKSPGPSVLYNGRNFQVLEDETKFELVIDLPGVRKDDVKITSQSSGIHIKAERKTGDTVTWKYSQIFAIDDTMVDCRQIKATMADGVLTVSGTKKELDEHSETVQDVEVPVTVGPAPHETEPSKKGFRLTIDVPGVKVDDLKVRYKNGELDVRGERTRGTASIHLYRRFAVDPRKVNVASLYGYLEDGVLMVLAPLRENPLPQTIPVEMHSDQVEESNPSRTLETQTMDKKDA